MKSSNPLKYTVQNEYGKVILSGLSRVSAMKRAKRFSMVDRSQAFCAVSNHHNPADVEAIRYSGGVLIKSR